MPKSYLLAFVFIFSYFSAKTQWRWLNPQPSGAASSKIVFTDNQNGFILNGYGELIRTQDMGASWHIDQTFSYTACLDMKGTTGVIGGYGGIFYLSIDKGNTWVQKNSGINDNFQNVFMLSADTFFFYSQYSRTIYKTSDRGSTWQTLICGNDAFVSNIFFVTADIGYAGTNDDILKTTDGGITWQSTNKSTFSPSNITAMFFYNKDIGYAFREHNQMLYTKDGGQTWQSTDVYDVMNAIYFTSENNGYAGGSDGAMYSTNNGGVSWEWIGFTARIDTYDINSLYFLSNNTGFAVGGLGRILKTTDGGKNWKSYAFSYDPIMALSFPEKNVGYAATGKQVFKTEDKGNTWKVTSNFELVDYIGGLQQMHFTDENKGFVTLSANTRVYYTSDGGKNWNDFSPTYYSYESISDIDFITPNTGFMILQSGSNSLIVKTKDGGATWEDVWKNQYAGESFIKIDYVTESLGFATRYGSVYKTTDNSKTWQKIFELDYGSINEVSFINEQKGFIAGDQGLLYMTTDGGSTWTKIEKDWTNIYPYDIKSIEFFNESTGYMSMGGIGGGGAILKTMDGGLTWNYDGYSGGNIIAFGKDTTVYVAGGGGRIVASNIKSAGLYSFITVNNDKCTVSFSAQSATVFSEIDNVWLEVKDPDGVITTTEMTKESEADNKSTYTVNIPGLKSGVKYSARLKCLYENEFYYYGSVEFYAKGYDQPNITTGNNGAVLLSSSIADNEWYLNDTLLQGLTGNQIAPPANGYYAVRINENGCTSLKSIPVFYIKGNLGVSIYPNPVTSYIWFNNTQQRTLDVKIVDINGVVMVSTTIIQSQQKLVLPHIPDGVYTIWITDRQTNEKTTIRFLKN
ncbi:MAG: YCF48-related protein [Agriterribacter sp.]